MNGQDAQLERRTEYAAEGVLNDQDAQLQQRMKYVLEEEKKGIEHLINTFHGQLVGIVKMCHACQGKIVWTGMGKSGHIARKISATMSSLGTPSFFLHPAEAVHGDLGMLQEKDLVILLSNSGNTDELIQLIPAIRAIGCKTAGIFCNGHGILSEYCDLVAVLPVEREACPNNLAPTTSTTVALAYGDAVAVVLSELNHFSEKDFALFHPKGSLGKKLLVTAGTLCAKQMENTAVTPDQTLEEVLFVITKNRLGAAAVVNTHRYLVGMISDGDIRRCMNRKKDIFSMKAGEIMTDHPVFVKADTLAVDVFQLMKQKKISVMPVVDGQHLLLGMLGLQDIISEGII